MALSLDDKPAPSTSKRRPLLLGGGAIALVAILGVAWWLGFLTPEPDPVSITEAVETVSAESTDADDLDTKDDDAAAQTDDDSEESTVEASDVSVTSIAGEWSVVESEATFIGYRADGNTGESVGRSPGVTGSLTATDTEITAVSIVGDMTLLESDSSVRDDHLGDEGLETNTYPTATFTLTEPIMIGAIPDAGVEETFTATGELTVKEITQSVTIDLQAVVVDGRFVVAGDTEIMLEDFGATIGNVTEATMEFSLVFSK